MDKKQKKGLSIKNFRRRFQAFLPSKWLLVLGILLVIIQTCLALLIPILTKDFVDGGSDFSGIKKQTLFLLIIVFVGQLVISGLALYTMTVIGESVVLSIREKTWKHILHLPVSFFDRHSSGEMMSRITNDTLVIKGFITNQLIPSISGIISISGSIILMLILDWKMTLIIIVTVPITMLVMLPLGKRMYKVSRSLQDETALFQSDLSRVLKDIRLVKFSVAENQEIQIGINRMKQLFSFGINEGKIMSIVHPISMSSTFILIAIIFGYGGIRITEGTLSSGALVAIIFYLFQITTPLTQLAQFFTEMQKALGASERLDQIHLIDVENNMPRIEFQNNINDIDNALSFCDVSFSYKENKSILKSLNFQAEIGQVTAFIGPSGAGKTTLFSLIECFYKPTEGNISYKGKSIHDISLFEWRNKIAYVSQDSPVMSGTIYSNLIYGLDEFSEEKVNEAVKHANLKDFIESLPNKYETEVGESGIRLSGGQRQRLAIARAMIRDPEILLLDEATAHLDSTSEKLVHKALETLMKGRTTLIIAHRLATVLNADQLLVLEEGIITGTGNHKELLEKHSLYKELVEQQLSS